MFAGHTSSSVRIYGSKLYLLKDFIRCNRKQAGMIMRSADQRRALRRPDFQYTNLLPLLSPVPRGELAYNRAGVVLWKCRRVSVVHRQVAARDEWVWRL